MKHEIKDNFKLKPWIILRGCHFSRRKIELLNFGNMWKATILLAERQSS